MKKFFLHILLPLVCGVFIFNLSITSSTAAYDTGLEATRKQVDAFKNQTSTASSDFINTKTGQIISLVLSFVGVLFLALMIYAGIMWMTSNGNEQTVSKSKDLILNAVIGIIIVLSAYAITSFLGNEVIK